MKLKFTLLTAVCLCTATAYAQEFAGFRTDNYNGVNGAFFNPASLSGSPYAVDVNIIGFEGSAVSKNSEINLKMFRNDDSNTLKKLTGDNGSNTLALGIALHMPSFSVRIDDKLSVAFLSRTRFLMNGTDLDGKLFNSLDVNSNGKDLSFTLNNATNMRLSATLFSEFGLAGAYEVYNDGTNVIRGGLTLKYLAGIGNFYLQMNNLKGTIYADSASNETYLSNGSGSVAFGMGGLNLNDFNSIAYNASGFGADLGAIYEYRPGNLEDENFQYLFKAGVAILDLGSVKYTALPQYTMGYSINVPAGSPFPLSNFDVSIDDLKQQFDKYPANFTKTGGLNNGTYRVALPRTLQLNGDVRAAHHFYVALNIQAAMSGSENKPYNNVAQSGFWLTPRFETRLFGAYMPISYANFGKFNMGLGGRVGPLYLGFNSLIGSHAMNMYLGFHVGFGNKSKADKE